MYTWSQLIDTGRQGSLWQSSPWGSSRPRLRCEKALQYVRLDLKQVGTPLVQWKLILFRKWTIMLFLCTSATLPPLTAQTALLFVRFFLAPFKPGIFCWKDSIKPNWQIKRQTDKIGQPLNFGLGSWKKKQSRRTPVLDTHPFKLGVTAAVVYRAPTSEENNKTKDGQYQACYYRDASLPKKNQQPSNIFD